ncbi:MAG: class I SAM-dependent methyltransferase [Verrucomicrobiales bacterium]|nr:class I SAM-dependent methyltransferase [Verrucomicrobiales bacterium]
MDYINLNKSAWDKRTGIHFVSEMYDVDGFLNGNTSLKEIELSEVGDVSGKTLLHLQCHFGLDTLSWARKGAEVTGVDLSPESIRKANELKERASLEGEFICSDVYGFEKLTTPKYDIVFVSYGALNWLSDLDHWARIVAKSLKVGGHLHLIEFHPAHNLYCGDSYFSHKEPDINEGGAYTENCSGETVKMATWSHPLSEVINALINNGIAIDHLNEFPFTPFNNFENLEEKEKGRFYLQNTKHSIPLIFSIKGTKHFADSST